MHMKRRNGRVYLYRTHWIPRGPGVPHGYSQQEYIGSVSADAVTLDHEVAQKLSDVEKRMLDERVLRPNVDRRSQEELERATRATDPLWRIEEARRLLAEAVPLTSAMRIPNAAASAIFDLANNLQVIAPVPRTTPSIKTPAPLDVALDAVRLAKAAVEGESFPKAPQVGFQNTAVYKSWVSLLKATTGPDDSLRKALQRAGYISKRATDK